MVKFLLQRPIAVLMAFTACFIVVGNLLFVACIFAARYCHTADYHTDDGREFIGTRVGEYGGHPCAQAVVASSRTEGDKK